MRSFAYLALLGSAAIATPALAQEVAPFTGARVEGIVGWDRTQANGHDDGALYGIGAGYDIQTGPALVGVEAELNDSSAKECVGAAISTDPRLCAKAGRDIYAGGRIGTIVNPGTLLYAKAGYTNGRYKLTSDAGAGSTVVDSTNLDGVRIGAGVEQVVGPNSFLKAEYRYSNYEQGVERHQALAGFGFRF